MLPQLLRAFQALPRWRTFASRLPPPGGSASVGGLPGGSVSVLLASLVERFPQRTFLFVSSGPAEAERWLADLVVLTDNRVRLYPQRESLGEEEPHVEIAGERVETVEALLRGDVSLIITTNRATAERTAMPTAIAATRLTLAVGDTQKPVQAIETLEHMGYERRPTVLDVAQFAVRGGILDLYGFGMSAAMRVEWWDDEIVSIREFDLDTQCSAGERGSVTALPVAVSVGGAPTPGDGTADDLAAPPVAATRQSLLELLPPDTLVVLEPGVTLAEIERMWSEAEHHLEVARRLGEDVPDRGALYLAPADWERQLGGFARLFVGRDPYELDFQLHAPDAVERDMKRLSAMIAAGPTLVLCDNEGQLERLEELLSLSETPGERLPANLTLAIGALHAGFVMPGLVVLTDHEIFRRARRIRRPRRYKQASGSAAAGALTAGDYVVHLDYGIGIYRGTETLTTGVGIIEVAVLEFAGGDRVNVPLYRVDQLERYRSGGDADSQGPPKLDRLGGKRWKRQRAKTESAIHRMAAELLELYAKRSLAAGYAFPPDTKWQAALESSFLYEDTPDQRSATDEVKRAMEQPHPMDCLVIGDVGYGKTEIAVRAAFKAATTGKQTAVLVPTTILAEQHARTFGDRVADFPIVIEVLSRFRSPAEQKDVLARLKNGRVDIVIGTHRLLSKDVEFHDLGLLIVDEEHRFGVRHKERLKALRLEVDVLTLTATPIPRTLHFALSGLRNFLLMQTPPRDRSPVLTFAEPWDDELLEEAIARELDRGGQVFFVHNRIETIETIAERVRRLAPAAARVEVAHGQTKERVLDEVMRAFGAGEVDILVSTMIVESGLDVANANTMVVHRADRFGLAQLYQLRGRVGRGHRRAYCYLVVPENMDPEAERRVKLLEHHTELGAGYTLAMRDLEFRGAGNFLGVEQSGHAHAVGFDLYMRWLADTVRALKGERSAEPAAPPEVILDGPAHFPEDFIPDEDAKLDCYRRLAQATHLDDISHLREEIRDRFGPLPAAADRLLSVFELRVIGAQLGVQSVLVKGGEARVKFRPDATPRMAGLNAALDEVQFAAEVRRVHPLMLRLTRLGGLELIPGLIRALKSVRSAEGTSPAPEPLTVKT
ncbi:MAG: transcription-repair coupling factor [Gemmatimonadetes bacterium]|nr:transcription-repair coupling factor [Gemmatimonadota bacterium]